MSVRWMLMTFNVSHKNKTDGTVEVAMDAAAHYYRGNKTLTLLFEEREGVVTLGFWDKDAPAWNVYPLDEFLEALMAGAREYNK